MDRRCGHMWNDIIIGVSFFIVVIISCNIYSSILMHFYNKSAKKDNSLESYQYDVNIDKLELAGVENDKNTDFKFIQAVENIQMSNDVRVRLYDED